MFSLVQFGGSLSSFVLLNTHNPKKERPVPAIDFKRKLLRFIVFV